MADRTPREIGDPERRGVNDTVPFSYQPGYSGTYSALSAHVFNDRTDEDVTATVLAGNTLLTESGGVLTTSSPQNMVAETVYRVHFRFTIGGSQKDEFRRVVVEK